MPDKIKHSAYVVNLDEYHDTGTHWAAFRLQAYDSVICGYFCIGFINLMLKGKSLTDFTNILSPNNFKKNDNIILDYFLTNL